VVGIEEPLEGEAKSGHGRCLLATSPRRGKRFERPETARVFEVR
jgi:hypothetical protein